MSNESYEFLVQLLEKFLKEGRIRWKITPKI